MEKKYCVYIHTNKMNGKKYVGQTCQQVEARWKHGDGYKNNIYFYRAIQKYGWDNFTHEIIKDKLTLEEANQLEIKLIEQFHTTDNNYGYNLRQGGSHGALSAETIEKIRQSQIGKVVSQETREKMRQASLGRKMPQSRIDFLKSQTGFKHPRSKPIMCINTGMIYGSSGEAERQLGISSRSIRAAASNFKGQKRAGGYEWRFLTEEEIQNVNKK